MSDGGNGFQKASDWEDRTIHGSLAPHSSISPYSLRKAKNLLAREVAKKRRDNEMTVAREVQRKLLPQHLPSLETLDYAGNWNRHGRSAAITMISSKRAKAEWALFSLTSPERAFPPLF